MALGNVGAMTVQLLGDIDKFKRGMDDAGGKVKSFGTTVTQVGTKIASAGKAMSIAITAPLVAFGVAAIKFASDAEEIQSKFEAVFKEFSEQTSVWIEEFADAVNRNATDLKNYAATFQDTFVPLGFARGEAAELSKALVELTIDLASFNNASEPETMKALQSAIVGNHETVRRFGVIINEAALNQELLNMGIKDGTKAATEAEKAQARLNLIIQGTADAQGDATRTSESFANQMKGIKGDLKSIGEDIGNILIPMLGPFIEKLKEMMDAFNELDEDQKERIVKLLIFLATIGPTAILVGNLAAAFGRMANAIREIGQSSIGGAIIRLLGAMTSHALALAAAAAALSAPFIAVAALGADLAEEMEGGVEAARDLVTMLNEVGTNAEEVEKALLLYINGIGAYLAELVEAGNLPITALSDLLAELEGIKDSVVQMVVDGIPVEEAVTRWDMMVRGSLSRYENIVPGIEGIVDRYLEEGMAGLSALVAEHERADAAITESLDERVKTTAERLEDQREAYVAEAEVVEIVKTKAQEMQEQIDELKDTLDNSTVGTLEYVEAVEALKSIYETLVKAAKAVEGQNAEVDASLQALIDSVEGLGIVLEESKDDVEVWGETYRDIISSTLADVTWEIVTFHRKVEDAQKEHSQKMMDIWQAAADGQLNAETRKNRSIEDAQTDLNRKLEDIEQWYQERVAAGDANTHEKKMELDAQRHEKIQDAQLNHDRKLEDIDTTYTRAIEDNEKDREQALDDELEAYEEQRPKITDIVETGFNDMVDAIVQSGIDKAIDAVVEWFWNMATEADLAAKATNASLASVGGGAAGALPIVAGAGAAVVASDIISGKSTGVAGLNKWLTDLIYGKGTYESRRSGEVQVSSFATGGVVPGPIGAPVPAIVHGGEPIGAAGFAEVFDYELLGEFVAAGAHDGIVDAFSESRSRGTSPNPLTKLAQLLYDPLQREGERRGGLT